MRLPPVRNLRIRRTFPIMSDISILSFNPCGKIAAPSKRRHLSARDELLQSGIRAAVSRSQGHDGFARDELRQSGIRSAVLTLSMARCGRTNSVLAIVYPTLRHGSCADDFLTRVM